MEAARLYRRWKQTQPKDTDKTPPGSAPTSTTEDHEESASAAEATIEEAEDQAWAEIENHLANMSPYDFQNLVAGLLRGMGYHIAWVSPPGPDKGIDIIAHLDALGITGPRIKVQVKRRPGERTAVDGVRSFMATLADGDIGLFVSTGGFSKDAHDEARRQEKRRITLVDLDRLFGLWVEHYNRIPEDRRRLLPLHPVYFLAADE
jgi:restriction system protein